MYNVCKHLSVNNTVKTYQSLRNWLPTRLAMCITIQRILFHLSFEKKNISSHFTFKELKTQFKYVAWPMSLLFVSDLAVAPLPQSFPPILSIN